MVATGEWCTGRVCECSSSQSSPFALSGWSLSVGDKVDPKIAGSLQALLCAAGAAYLLRLGWHGIVRRRLKGRDKMLEGEQAVRMGILFTFAALVGLGACAFMIWAVMTGRAHY